MKSQTTRKKSKTIENKLISAPKQQLNMSTTVRRRHNTIFIINRNIAL
jgi:hypothetical protein